jgi:hypothetical protein
MPSYTTQYVKNLTTGESITFEVDEEKFRTFERQRRLIEEGQAPLLGSVEDLVIFYEFSFFPAYHELLKIFFENGFTTELITEILQGFGLDESFIGRLLDDEKFISGVRPWFEGITSDGERASRTLRVVYDTTKSYFTPDGKSGWEWAKLF